MKPLSAVSLKALQKYNPPTYASASEEVNSVKIQANNVTSFCGVVMHTTFPKTNNK
jgi:hypothetical protein